MTKLPAIPEFTYEEDWQPAIRVATKTLAGNRRKEFHELAQHARHKAIRIINSALRNFVVTSFQRGTQLPPSALVPKLKARATGKTGKPDPKIDPVVDMEMSRAAAQVGTDDPQEQARIALANIKAKIRSNVRHKGAARHRGDKDLDHLVGSINSAWIEGFGEIPAYTPYRSPYAAFLRSITHSFAVRLPDEYKDARISLLVISAKDSAARKRFRNTGISKLKAFIGRILKN